MVELPQKKTDYDKELLRRIENLIRAFQKHVQDAEGQPEEENLVYGLRVLVSLANMILRKEPVFGIEPWHILSSNVPLSCPGEMLLRVKDYRGENMPPYPAIMAFYNHGFTADIDGVLFLAALWQFQNSDEKQVSINISARSLRDPEFVRTTLERLESLNLQPDEKIMIEIHESQPHLAMSRQVLDLYKGFGVSFVIDDIGLNMNDVMRLADFEGMAEFAKIDRHAVCAEDDGQTLTQVLEFVRTLLPGAVCVAEGVQNAQHALDLKALYPDIGYVQGLFLTDDRDQFKLELYNAGAAQKTEQAEVRASKANAS